MEEVSNGWIAAGSVRWNIIDWMFSICAFKNGGDQGT